MQLLFVFIIILFVASVSLLSVANEAEVIRQQSAQYSPKTYERENEGFDAQPSAVH